MHALDVIGDPVRRHILQLLAAGERTAGEIGAVVQQEFGLSQPAVSQQLRVLRENGFVTVRLESTRRFYAVNPEPFQEVDKWLEPFRRFWVPLLDALETEIARGKRERHVRHDTQQKDIA